MSEHWLMLVISVPGKSATPRMRIWRALKASGAGIMRDGVYVLPASPANRNLLAKQAAEVDALDGSAYLLEQHTPDAEATAQFRRLFDRTEEYAAWQARALAFKQRVPSVSEAQARREQAQLRRELETLTAIDFFPGEHHDAAQRLQADIEHTLNEVFSPDEPSASAGTIPQCDASDYAARRWATRANLWVDRVASAWLIKRFIDPDATFVWLRDVADLPPDCVGFDFDGAASRTKDGQSTENAGEFHVGHKRVNAQSWSHHVQNTICFI